MIKTKDLDSIKANPLSKRNKVLKLKEFHTSLFEKEKVNNPKFIPRMCYKHRGVLVIGFYVKEIYMLQKSLHMLREGRI